MDDGEKAIVRTYNFTAEYNADGGSKSALGHYHDVPRFRRSIAVNEHLPPRSCASLVQAGVVKNSSEDKQNG